ncbi:MULTISPECIES: hypothetical protein [unclassified Streptomyces]|uniref:hypothetical protein n=1 Tax=unclassified Streptomyces TaxID=2593676 RepID=UPI0036E0A2BE
MTADGYDDGEELARLGGAVEAFISTEGMQFTDVAERADFSIETLAKIRKGVKVSAVSYRKLERALGWAAGSVDAVRAGGTPTLEVPGAAAGIPVEEPVDPQAAAILTILDGLPERVQREVLRRLGDRLPRDVRHSD